MNIRKLSISLLAVAFFAVSCGGGEHKTENNEAAPNEMHEDAAGHDEAEDHEGHDHDAMMEEAEGSDLLSIAEGAKVFFANLEDGQTVSSPVKIEFGVEGMEVEPAGALNEGKGHHHIIIDGGALERGEAVPADSMNIHYGKGQTEAEIELSAGEHTLTMQFADGYHQSYGKQMSATIKVVVE